MNFPEGGFGGVQYPPGPIAFALHFFEAHLSTGLLLFALQVSSEEGAARVVVPPVSTAPIARQIVLRSRKEKIVRWRPLGSNALAGALRT